MESCHYVLRSASEVAILRGLISDAFLQAVKAYGGRAQFKEHACYPPPTPGDFNSPIVEQELQKFCSR